MLENLLAKRGDPSGYSLRSNRVELLSEKGEWEKQGLQDLSRSQVGLRWSTAQLEMSFREGPFLPGFPWMGKQYHVGVILTWSAVGIWGGYRPSLKILDRGERKGARMLLLGGGDRPCCSLSEYGH